jgi:hypothetical protein
LVAEKGDKGTIMQMRHLRILFILLFSSFLLSCYTAPISDRDSFIRSLLADGQPLPDDKHKENRLIQKELDRANISIPIEKADLVRPGDIFYDTAKNTGYEWLHSEFIPRIERLLDEKNDIVLSEQDVQRLCRYLRLTSEEQGGVPAADLSQQIIEEYGAIKEKKEALLQEFRGKWPVDPSGSLFDDKAVPSIDTTLKSAKPIYAEYYQGEDPGIRFLLDYHNKIIEVYKDVGQDISNETNELLEKNFKVATTELNTSIKEANASFAEAVAAYESNCDNLDTSFRKFITDKVPSLPWNTLNLSPDFDYIIQNQSDDQEPYLIVYNRDILLREDGEVEYFWKKGVSAEILGVVDAYVYLCQDGEIRFFDAFTMEQKEELTIKMSELNQLSQEKERILFLLSTGEHRAITKDSRGYSIKKIEKNDKQGYVLKPISRSKEK